MCGKQLDMRGSRAEARCDTLLRPVTRRLAATYIYNTDIYAVKSYLKRAASTCMIIAVHRATA